MRQVDRIRPCTTFPETGYSSESTDVHAEIANPKFTSSRENKNVLHCALEPLFHRISFRSASGLLPHLSGVLAVL